MIRRIAAAAVIVGLSVYVAESYLGTCGLGSGCVNDLNVLAQPFWHGAFGNMFDGAYYAPFAYAILGLVLAICGATVFLAASLGRVATLRLREMIAALAGWSLVAVGLSALVVSLSEGYICMEYCFNVNNSFFTEWGGFIATLAGLTVVASAVLASQLRPAGHHRLGRWPLAAIVIALMASTLWTASTAYSTYVHDSNAFNFQSPPVETYTPCLQGYSGFQVTGQYPNPSTWTFELVSGSTGLIFYQYYVTKGLDLLLSTLNEPLSWTIWQVLPNGTNILAEINGSTVTSAESFVPNSNKPNTQLPPASYALGVQLKLVDYAVRGNLVNATWSIAALTPGSYPVESLTWEWLTFNVTSASGPPLNTTSETFPGNCYG